MDSAGKQDRTFAIPEHSTQGLTPAKLPLRRFDERHDLHLAATLGTTQRVDFIDRLINIARAWLLRVAAEAGVGSSADDWADASAAIFFRMPRDLFKYQP